MGSEFVVLRGAQGGAHCGVDELLAQAVIREDLRQTQVGKVGDVHGWVLKDSLVMKILVVDKKRYFRFTCV